MAKVEVQIRSCFCCGLHVATILVAIYTLFLYAILLGLAIWGMNDTMNHGDTSNYRSCDLEAQGKLTAENRKLTFHGGHTTVVVEDSSSYHCSFGLYTEELKYEQDARTMWLWIDILLYGLIVFASIVFIIGLCVYNHILLGPWVVLMILDIIRGFISTFFIFWFSHSNLARIATAIFFLGLQFLHISLVIIVIAKAQRIYNRKKGIPVDRPFEQRSGYPASSAYGYSPDHRGRDPYYPPSDLPPHMAAPRDPYYNPQQAPYDNHAYNRY